MSEKTEYIYHYTDFNALKGIVENKEIWLNNIFSSNDSKELKYFYENIKDKILLNLNSKEKNETKAGVVLKKLNFEMSFNLFMKYISERPFYATCFSILADDAAQWERYANNATGICLEFNKDILIKILPDDFKSGFTNYGFNMEECKELVSILEEFVKKEQIGTFNKELFYLKKIAALFKHESFQSEKEFRIYIDHKKVKTEKIEITDQNGNLIEKFVIDVRKQIINNSIKEYCLINLEELCKRNRCEVTELITGITLAPKARISEDVLQRYLRDKGMVYSDEKVRKSNCPLQ